MADKVWEALVDPSSGATYYACDASGETSWEVPPGYTWKEGDPPMPETSGSGWSEATDPDSGATYYMHTDGRTTWEKPDDFEGGGDTAAASGEAAATPAGGSDWEEMTDPDSGATYYANNTTGETSWEKPEGFVKPGGDDAPAAAESASAPEPVAAAAPPVPSTAAAAATDTATPSSAPAPAAPAAAKGTLSPETLALWTKAVNKVKEQARAAITDRASRFRSLRKFAASNARANRTPGTTPSSTPVGGAGAGAGVETKGGAAAASGNQAVWSFLNLPVEAPPRNSMEEYAENYFNLNRKGVFGKKTTVAKILSWKNDIIKTALRKMPSKDLNSQATQCFRNITGFMGDRSTTKDDGGHGEKLLKACLGAPEELRDEVYCQLVKQTSNNSRPDGNLKGWQLFSICTGAFPPSKTFEPYLLSYLHSHVEDPGGIGKLAGYALGRVHKAGELGPRRETPTAMEIDACKSALPVIIRVYLLDGTFHSMPVVSWTTAKDMNKMMAHKLGIKNDSAFACYEITPEGEERYLESDERLLDMVAYWQRLFEEEKGKSGKEKTSIVNLYRVAYKTHMYFDADADDDAAERMLYTQAVYDVVSSRYPCNEEDTLTLAALQMQYEYEDDTLDGLEEPRKLKRFLPVKFAEGSRQAELAKEIQKRHAAHVTKTKDEARKEYLAHVRKWKIYGSSFFYVEPQMSVDLPDEVFLAVNPKGVLIINPESKEVLAEHPYSEVPTWGHSGSSFVLHIGNLIRQTKLYFETEQGKDINNLVRSYVNHLCVA